jgi:hypothetical protein
VPKWLKFILALLLLPVCFGAAQALGRVVTASGKADTVWAMLLAGAGCWGVIFYLLPKPMLAYVYGHELTHVLWAWLFGGRLKRFKATSKGGHVVVTKTNFLIALAPYFFPLYAVLVVLGFLAGDLLWDWHEHAMWFHLLLGAAYAFHVMLTLHILQSTQTDITEHGWVFSAVIVFLGNVLVLIAGLPLLTGRPELAQAFRWWGEGIWSVVAWVMQFLPRHR